jgi:Fe2+ or Zn2+ uptake regulation protein
MRLTSPRRKVLEIFMTSDRLCTAGDLFQLARNAGARVGLTTVYRLLAALSRLGLAKPYIIDGNEVKYAFCSSQHHHHIICKGCGLFTEVFTCPLRSPRVPNFRVEDHQLDFFGICFNCQHQEEKI